MKKKLTTYEEVGAAAGLEASRLKLYVKYMEARWKSEEGLQCATGYAEEWARRFLRGEEWNSSDLTGQRVLMKLTPRTVELSDCCGTRVTETEADDGFGRCRKCHEHCSVIKEE